MQNDPERLPPLDLLVAFEAAARHLSFTRAGAERFVTQSAISRQIRALEDELGVALFRRRHRALALTDEGQRLQASCVAVLAQLRAAVSALRAPARREVLALTTTPGLASLWLIPRLPSFTKMHPGIDVRMDTSFERRDLRADGFDLAIRYGRVGKTEGRQLFSEAMLPVCSPKLLRGRGPALRTPADLRQHTLLQLASMPGAGMPLEWAPWLQAVGLTELQPAATLSFSGYGEAIAAALAGQGVALGRRPLVDALLRSGKLVAPFKDATASIRAYYLVVEPAARSKPAVRALESWLLEQAAREA
ncbi:transcriptional regulator GcvA [Piscinibacter sp.]|jgi:LysR family glycine cleavage system transcriptional activator|uniref:transcriptional regulator GcvA n=1 Tax=Piscinibacter sp. TaxID=1903157 RepID=UPI00355A3693